MKLKKIIAICIIVALGCASLSGCAKSSTNDKKEQEISQGTSKDQKKEDNYEPITVSFWNGWTGSDGDVLLELVEEFNKENPYNITVEMDINSEFQEKFAAACAANQGPDMILGANNYKFLYQDYLIDMNKVFDTTSLKKENFVPSFMDACSLDGNLYVLPFQITGRYLYWNKDLFTAAGLDPEAPPTTYEEWAEYASLITDESKNVYGSGLQYNNVFNNLQILQRFGGIFVSEDGNGSFKANFEGNAGYEKFLNWFKGMADKGDNPIESDTESMMKAGQIGITTAGGWLNAGLKEAGVNYGVTLLPATDIGEINPNSVSGFSVTTFASEEAKQACLRFVEWWYEGYEDTETTGVLRWSLDCGYPTFYLPIMDDERYVASEILSAMTVTDPNIDSSYMAADTFKNTFSLAFEAINPLIESVVAGGVDVKEALSTAQQTAESIIATE